MLQSLMPTKGCGIRSTQLLMLYLVQTASKEIYQRDPLDFPWWLIGSIKLESITPGMVILRSLFKLSLKISYPRSKASLEGFFLA